MVNVLVNIWMVDVYHLKVRKTFCVIDRMQKIQYTHGLLRIGLKNVKPLEAKEFNEKVVTAYNTSIMNEAKTSEIVRGPSFF